MRAFAGQGWARIALAYMISQSNVSFEMRDMAAEDDPPFMYLAFSPSNMITL